MSSQFHTIGTAAGRDLYERLTGKEGHEPSVLVMRIAILVGLLLAVTTGARSTSSMTWPPRSWCVRLAMP